ncbi:MAG: PilN domain-containing protein [Lentisphaerae bacterium]|nr:PilN domain-containing protein [Lentisphaerota bacterium]
MAREFITGVVFRGDTLEWAVLRRGREGVERADAGCAAWREAPAEAEAGAESGGAEAQAAREAETARLRAAGARLRGDVDLGLGAGAVILRVVDLPTVEDDEIAAMAALQVDKFSPFAEDAAVWGHEVLARRENASRVLIGVARRSAVEEAGERLRRAGVSPRRVDAEALGWWEVLREAGDAEGAGRRVVLLLGAGDPVILVLEEGVPLAFRAVGGAGELAEDALAGELARETGYVLTTLELEHGGGTVQGVRVRCSGEPPAGLAELLQDACGCAVDVRPLEGLAAAEGVARRGAAKGGVLDLTPESWREAARRAGVRKRLVTAALVVLAVWLAGAGIVLGALGWQQRRTARLAADRDRWRGPAMEVRELRRRVFMIKRYRDRNFSALECLREVSRLLPEGIDLTSFSYYKGEELRLAGEAAGVNLVYSFKNTLDESALFGEAELQGPRTDRRRRREVFEITLALPQEEP